MSRELDGVRRRVLDASIALVAEQGVRAVSFREVARRAGVSHQAPYHHFGDHHGILRAIAQEGFVKLTRAMQDAAGKHEEPLAALVASGVAYVTFARKQPGYFRVMFQRTSGDDEDLPEAIEAYMTLVRLATAVHRAGHGNGLSIEVISRLAHATVHGIASLLVEGSLRTKREDAVVREVVESFVGLLGERAAKKTRRSASRR